MGPLEKEGSALNAIAAQLNQGRATLASNQETLNAFKATAKTDTESTIQDVLANRPVLVQTNDVLNDTLNQIADHQPTVILPFPSNIYSVLDR